MRLNLREIIHVPGASLPFAFQLDLSQEEFFGEHPIPRPVQVQGRVKNVADVLVLEGEEDEDIVLLENGEVDVGDLAYTAFLLAMDTKHLCSEDCKGLCPGCGVNLNREPCRCKKQVDPRWAALEQLLDKN